MNNRRSSIEIIADILRLGEASKTQVMYSASMSYAQLQKYLDYLISRGFLVRDTDGYPRGIFRVTREGKMLLKSIEKIEELLTIDETGKAGIVNDSLVGQKNVRKPVIISRSKSILAA